MEGHMVELHCLRIISGGQSGVDRGALDAAIAAGLSHAGACPAGRRAEDGVIDARYQLTETKSANPASRTRRNVQESDATLILSPTAPYGGTLLAVNHAGKLSRPFLIVDPFAITAAAEIVAWLKDRGFQTLNIAGPRESESPGIADRTRSVLSAVFSVPEYAPDRP
jgi:hypothetical protein